MSARDLFLNLGVATIISGLLSKKLKSAIILGVSATREEEAPPGSIRSPSKAIMDLFRSFLDVFGISF